MKEQFKWSQLALAPCGIQALSIGLQALPSSLPRTSRTTPEPSGQAARMRRPRSELTVPTETNEVAIQPHASRCSHLVSLTDVKAVTAGALHSLVLKNGGTVVGWDHNWYE